MQGIIRGMRKRAIGWDPGFRNLGYAVVDVEHNGDLYPVKIGVFTTEKSDKKRKVMSADDDMRRGEELAMQMVFLCRDYKPNLFAVESRSFVRNARANAQIGMFWGMLAMLKGERGLPLVEALPQEIRRALGVTKGSAKDAVHSLLVKRYGAGMLSGIKPGLQEHALDAFASVEAAKGSEIFRAVTSR